jgi:flavin-dependent thymidylate synthase
MDNILTINSVINKFIEEENRPKYDYFDKYELGDFATITLCFKDMSRTATHQLVRHRNGITQESQRYVDYSKHGFINPLDYSAEKYKESDPTNATYNFNGERLTLNQLSNKLMSYYEVLVNDKNAPLHKEDARSFLPSNVACAKLYMTFTFRTFAKFLELRDHIAAQSEIRAFAHACSIWFNSLWDESLNMHPLGFLTSKYSIALKKASYIENIKEE